MKARELEKLNREHLLPRLPEGWAAKGPMLFSTPIGDLLRAIDFEPSGFVRDTRRIRYFVMPLYRPDTTYVHFGYSRVLGGVEGGKGDHWFDFPEGNREPVMTEIAERVQTEALPWLDRLRTPADLARHGMEIHGNDLNPNVVVEIGFSNVLAGNDRAAAAELLRVRDMLAGDPAPTDWQIQLTRASELVRADLEDGHAKAVRRLRQWRREALDALGLTKWADDHGETPDE